MINKTLLTSYVFFFSSRRRHTRLQGDWSSDVCSSDLPHDLAGVGFGVLKIGGRIQPPAGFEDDDLQPGVRQRLGHDAAASASADYRDKIGRASCRERV